MRGQRNKTETTLISRTESTGTCEVYFYGLRRVIFVKGNGEG